MKTYIIISAVLLALISCKKEQLQIPTTEKPNNCYTPTTMGSYWIYDWVEVDTNGVETPLPYKDTLRIIGDTTINNYVYTITRGTSMGGTPRSFFTRDSSGYIVNNRGNISYSYTNFTDTIHRHYDPQLWNYNVKMFNNIQVSIPIGTFSSLEARRFYFYPSGDPANNFGDPYFTLSSLFVQGVGKVKGMTGWINDLMNCGTIMEQRLVEYYIAP